MSALERLFLCLSHTRNATFVAAVGARVRPREEEYVKVVASPLSTKRTETEEKNHEDIRKSMNRAFASWQPGTKHQAERYPHVPFFACASSSSSCRRVPRRFIDNPPGV